MSPVPEARLVGTNHVVIALSGNVPIDGFAGVVITDPSDLPDLSTWCPRTRSGDDDRATDAS